MIDFSNPPLDSYAGRRLALTAYHEAGHAVADVVLGIDVDHVTIVPQEDTSGHETVIHPDDIKEGWGVSDYDDPRVRLHVENFLIGLLAGPYAGRKFYPKARLQATETLSDGRKVLAAGSDHSYVVRIIADIFGDDNDQVRWTYERYVTARARALVETHWRSIELVANALLKRKTLSGDEVKRVMWAALRPAEAA